MNLLPKLGVSVDLVRHAAVATDNPPSVSVKRNNLIELLRLNAYSYRRAANIAARQ
jgi:hypothetical protein